MKIENVMLLSLETYQPKGFEVNAFFNASQMLFVNKISHKQMRILGKTRIENNEVRERNTLES